MSFIPINDKQSGISSKTFSTFKGTHTTYSRTDMPDEYAYVCDVDCDDEKLKLRGGHKKLESGNSYSFQGMFQVEIGGSKLLASIVNGALSLRPLSDFLIWAVLLSCLIPAEVSRGATIYVFPSNAPMNYKQVNNNFANLNADGTFATNWIASTGAASVASSYYSSNWIAGNSNSLRIITQNWNSVTSSLADVQNNTNNYQTGFINAGLATNYMATNTIYMSATNAAETYSANLVTVTSNNLVNAIANSSPITHPRAGLWAMNYSKEVIMLQQVLEAEAGFWALDTVGELVLTTNFWTDAWWETNALGHAILKGLPSYTPVVPPSGLWTDTSSYSFLIDQPITGSNAPIDNSGTGFNIGFVGGTLENFGTNATRTPLAENGWFIDAVDDYFMVTNSSKFSFGNGTNDLTRTVCFWLKPIATGARGIFSKYSSTTTKCEWKIYLADPYKLSFIVHAGTSYTNYYDYGMSYPITASNTWVFVTLVSDGLGLTNSFVAYTNAAVAPWSTLTLGGTYTCSKNIATDVRVGIEREVTAGQYLGGYLDFLGVIPTNLTPAEISTLYQNLGGASGPVGNIRARLPAGAYP